MIWHGCTAMPQSLTNLLIHVVFSTYGREPYLTDSGLRREMHHYSSAFVEWLKLGALWLAMAAWLSAVPLAGPWAAASSLGLGALVLLAAGRLHALGVILHDACHMADPSAARRAPGGWRLAWVDVLAGYPITSTMMAMRFHHLRHHRDSCLPADPYFKRGIHGARAGLLRGTLAHLQGLIITTFWTMRALLGATLSFLGPASQPLQKRMLDVYRRVLLQDKGEATPASTAEALACARADRGQVAFFIASVALTIYWPPLLIGYWLPLLIAGLLNAHRVIAEHRHVLRSDRSVASMLDTTVSHRGLAWRIVFYPRNIGYHEVHHLYPTVPAALLPAVDGWWRDTVARRGEAIVQPAARPGMPASTPALDASTAASTSQKRPQSKPLPPTPGWE